MGKQKSVFTVIKEERKGWRTPLERRHDNDMCPSVGPWTQSMTSEKWQNVGREKDEKYVNPSERASE